MCRIKLIVHLESVRGRKRANPLDPVIHVARACPRSASTTSAGKPSAGTRESSCSGDVESGCSGTLGIRLRFQHYPHIGVADAPRSPPADRGPLADLSFDPSGSRYPFVDGEHPEKIEYPGATLQEGTRSRQPANISTQHTAHLLLPKTTYTIALPVGVCTSTGRASPCWTARRPAVRHRERENRLGLARHYVFFFEFTVENIACFDLSRDSY